MKVTFRVNLGSVDAKPLGLDHSQCKLGDTVDVDKQTGELLIKSGIALTPEDARTNHQLQSALAAVEEAEAAKIKAVAKPAAITAPGKQ